MRVSLPLSALSKARPSVSVRSLEEMSTSASGEDALLNSAASIVVASSANELLDRLIEVRVLF